jgi:hypothetical protein
MFLSIPKLSSKGLLNLYPNRRGRCSTRSPSQDRRDARKTQSALKHLPKKQTQWPRGAIFTVGHSTLPIDRFITLIDSYGIERLADVRPCRARHQLNIQRRQWRSDSCFGTADSRSV